MSLALVSRDELCLFERDFIFQGKLQTNLHSLQTWRVSSPLLSLACLACLWFLKWTAQKRPMVPEESRRSTGSTRFMRLMMKLQFHSIFWLLNYKWFSITIDLILPGCGWEVNRFLHHHHTFRNTGNLHDCARVHWIIYLKSGPNFTSCQLRIC